MQDGTDLQLGHGTVIGFIAMTLGLSIVLRFILAKKNRDRQRLMDERGGMGYSMEEMKAHGQYLCLWKEVLQLIRQRMMETMRRSSSIRFKVMIRFV